MTSADAMDLYLAQIYAGQMPDADQQLRWIDCIEQAQQRLNQVLANCPSVWPMLVANLRSAQAANRLTRVIARCTQVGALETQAQHLIDGLSDPAAAAQRIGACLHTLRLRTECSAALLNLLDQQVKLGATAALLASSRTLRKSLFAINHATGQLVQGNQRLVASLARQYRYGPLAFMDLVQEGNLGLLRAIERFDPERGTRVSTYALWWVRRAMVYAIARQGQAVRPSVAQYWEARHVLRATERMERVQGRAVSQAETAQQLGVSVANLHQAMAIQAPVLALDAPIANTDGIQAMERLTADNHPEPEQCAQTRDLYHVVRRLLDKLPARHAKILRMRFGIDVHDDCTLEQIAQQQGVTRERIRQLEAQALKALRDMDEAWALQDILR